MQRTGLSSGTKQDRLNVLLKYPDTIPVLHSTIFTNPPAHAKGPGNGPASQNMAGQRPRAYSHDHAFDGIKVGDQGGQEWCKGLLDVSGIYGIAGPTDLYGFVQ